MEKKLKNDLIKSGVRSLGAENDGIFDASGLGLISVRETGHDNGFSASRRQTSARVFGRIVQIQDLKYRELKTIFLLSRTSRF